jgi:biotin transport system substrate-specific component
MTTLAGLHATPRSGALADRLMPHGLVADALLVAAGALAIAASAQVRLPLPFTPVPLTGQTFAILLVGSSLGLRRGALTTLVYLLAGIAGAPVFTNAGHGLAVLLGPTGGYLIGFLAASVILGAAADRTGVRTLLPAVAWMAAGSAVIYAFGVAGLMIATGVSAARALEIGVWPFLVGDVIKAALAGALLPVAWTLLPRSRLRR